MARRLAAVGIIWLAVAAPAAGAATWRDLPVPLTVKANPVIPSPTVAGLAWMPIDNQKLLVTHDGGVSWAPSPYEWGTPPVQDALPSRLWRAGGQQLERSDDGGVTWQAVPGLAEALKPTAVSLYGTSVGQLLADTRRSGVLYVVARVYEAYEDYGQTVFESTDGGITWSHWPYAKRHTSRGDRGFATTWSALPGRDALLLVRSGALEDEVEQEVSVVSAAGSTRLQYGTGTRGPGDEASGTIVGLTLTGRAALDPSGARILLESKRGWQLSTDAGLHFALLDPAIAARRVPPVFDPSRPGRIYVVRNGRLLRSDDEGRTWEALAPGLRNVQSLAVDAGGLIYVTGLSGLASSQDAGATFASLSSLATPIIVNSMRDDARGGLLASTDHGVWRIGSDERWTPLDGDLFPLPALSAAPLGRTLAVLVVRSPVEDSLGRSADPGARLEVVSQGVIARVLQPPLRRGTRWAGTFSAIASDSNARQVAIGADWTATGGRNWHIAPSTSSSSAPWPSTVMYSTRATGIHPASLWRRSGARPWKRIARLPGRECRQIAGDAQRLFVACAGRLLRSVDAGRTFRRIVLPVAPAYVQSLVVQPRRSDHIALLFQSRSGCTQETRTVTLTSTDAGRTWLRTADPCGATDFDHLTLAPNGALLRWSTSFWSRGVQVLDGWR